MLPFLAFQFEADAVWEFLFNEQIVDGAWMTLKVAVISQVIGITLGVVFALMRLSKNPLFSGFANFYIWFIRGTPALIQLFFLKFGIPSMIGDPDIAREFTFFRAAIIAFGINEGAYMSEIVRAGILSVESGQMDAAKSVGMTYLQAMRRIVFPQAMRVMLPPTGNEFIAMLKNTSLASAIGLVELLRATRQIYARNFLIMELLVVASIWYLAMTTVFSILQAELERAMAVGERERPETLFSRVLAIIGGRRGI
ncbi:MAG: amino acid ABC transporter permease [Chloroflexi bacterium]|nr:amino acid ABC transporter permease [Chloroflexota bacterium]